jgi:hypoxanthine phosphoribosyltransferase
MIPPVTGARLVATTVQVEAACQRLATSIQPAVAGGGCVLLGILLGGAVPLVRIAGLLEGDFMMDACRVGRYGDATRGGIPQWASQPRAAIRGQHVILVDDIFDEGITLDFVATWCREQGAREISTAVLVRKRHDRAAVRLVPDHVGLEVGDEYVFGCGMDYQGRWRHLDAIWGLPGQAGSHACDSG